MTGFLPTTYFDPVVLACNPLAGSHAGSEAGSSGAEQHCSVVLPILVALSQPLMSLSLPIMFLWRLAVWGQNDRVLMH